VAQLSKLLSLFWCASVLSSIKENRMKQMEEEEEKKTH
jgi:hypothetical protein